MATNKRTGDNARKGAVRKRSQTKTTTLGGETTWTKRDKSSGEFMAIKKAGKAAKNKLAASKKTTVQKTAVAKSGTKIAEAELKLPRGARPE